MRRKLAIGGVICVAGLGALVFYLRGGEGGAGGSEKALGDEEILARRHAARRAGEVDTSPAMIGGRVLAGGQGVSGAVVSVTERTFDGGARARPGASPEPMVVTTDPGGAWRVGELRPGRYSVSASAPGYLPASIESLELSAGEERLDLDLTIESGGHELSGTVTDIGGGPVAGAMVRARHRSGGVIGALFRAPFTARTDAAGRYSINLGDGTYELTVFHMDYVEAKRSTEIRGGPRVEDFRMVPGAVIEGRVLSRADEQPVAGAMVTRMGDFGFEIGGVGEGAAVTDAEGRFTMRGLSSGAVSLRASGPGFASKSPKVVELGIAEHLSGVVLYVDRAYTIKGFVVDKDDRSRALSGVLVGAFNFRPGALYVATDPSAEDGYFEIHGVKPGDYVVGAAGEQRVPTIMGANVTVEDRDLDDVIVEIDDGIAVSGRVDPPGPAELSVEIDTSSIGFGNIASAVAAQMVSGKADEDGRFTLEGLGPGEYTLRAETSEGRIGKEAVVLEDRDLQDVVIGLEERARLGGVVVDETGRPVSGVEVSAAPASRERGFSFGRFGSKSRTAITRPDGTFEIRGLDEGEHRVRVEDDGVRLAWAPPTAGKDPHEALEIEIEGTRSVRDQRLVVVAKNQEIRGRVVGPGGAPVADAWVTARYIPPEGADPFAEARERMARRRGGEGEGDGEEERSVTVSVSVSSSGGESRVETSEGEEDEREQRRRFRSFYPAEPPVLTDLEGRFVVRNLQKGVYDLDAEGMKGSARGSLSEISTGADVVLRLETLGSVTGVVSHDGNPVKDYVVSIRDGVTRNRRRPVNDAEGRYRLSRLRPGKYTLQVVADEGRASGEVKVTMDREAELDFDLVPYSSVTGRVVDAVSGEPMTGLKVMAFTEGADMASTGMQMLTGDGPETDGDGRFRIGRLGAGEGSVMVFDGDMAGFEPVASKSFEIGPGEELDLGTIRGSAGDRVPREERGELGMVTLAATWEDRPLGEGERSGDEPPSGIDPEKEYLWVHEVEEGGPAAEAGLQVGDRIVSVGGVQVEMVGPAVARHMLAPIRIRAGDQVQLGIARESSRESVELVARPQEGS